MSGQLDNSVDNSTGGTDGPAVKIGCAETPPRMSRAQVFRGLDFLEESFLLRAGPPSAKSLRKWRRDAPDAAQFIVVAGDGVFADGAERASAVEALLAAREALDAKAIVFRTPSGFSPSQTHRDRFRALCASEVTADAVGGATRVLWPRGLWDLELGAQLSDDLDLVLCFDPLRNDPLEELPALLARAFERGVAYLRLERIGTPRRRYDPYELETLGEIASELDAGWLSFAHSERVRDATALKKLLAD